MYGGSPTFVGALVQKNSYADCLGSGPAAHTVFGRVLSVTSTLPSGETAYHVVYEDGDEANLPASEVKLWGTDRREFECIGNTGATTDRPPISTVTQRSVAQNTAPYRDTSTTASFRLPLRYQSPRARYATVPLWRQVRRALSGPMPPPDDCTPPCFDWGTVGGAWTQPHEACRFAAAPVWPEPYEAWRLAGGPAEATSSSLFKGLLTLLFVLVVAFASLQAVECLWHTAPGFNEISWWNDLAVGSKTGGEASNVRLGAAWAAAKLDLASAFAG